MRTFGLTPRTPCSEISEPPTWYNSQLGNHKCSLHKNLQEEECSEEQRESQHSWTSAVAEVCVAVTELSVNASYRSACATIRFLSKGAGGETFPCKKYKQYLRYCLSYHLHIHICVYIYIYIYIYIAQR